MQNQWFEKIEARETHEYYELHCGVSLNVKPSRISLEMLLWVVTINVDHILVTEPN